MSWVIESWRPDHQRALGYKRALALGILADVGQVVEAVAPIAWPVVDPLLTALTARAEVLPKADVSLAVGPEIYRWLGEAGPAANCGDKQTIALVIESLPGLLFGRMVAAGVDGSGLRLPLREGVLRIPLAGVTLPTCAGSLAGVELTCEHLIVDGVCIERAAVMDRIDGASPATLHLGDARICFHQRGDFVTAMVADLSNIASLPIRHDEGLAPVPMAHFDAPDIKPIVTNMSAGLRLIRKHAPEHAAEVEAVMDAITLVTGRRFVGGSDIFYHGVAVLNPDVDWSPTTYADHLVHEGAHILLHARNELTPLLRNGDAMGAKSPIREDSRPLYGILHSTFVFLRLVQFFRRAAEAIGSDEAMFRLHRHLLGFYDGMAELERFAWFTHAGEAWFEGLRVAMADFRATLPEPDPHYYRRVGKDYVV